MSSEMTSTRVPSASHPPGVEVLVLVRRLVITALLAGVGYSMFSTASQSFCPGGITADGGFTDRFGNPTDVAPSCIDLTLRPSPAVYLVLALIVAVAVNRVIREVENEAAALRVLGWAGPAVIVAAIVAIVMVQISFASIPLERWDGASMPPVPGWLAVDVVIIPMQTS